MQCENCHGPGLNHVKNPTVVANRPIPSILIYPNVTTNATVLTAADTANVINSGCGACHTDEGTAKHHNYLKEWLSSRHGQLRQSQAANVSCQPCHEGKGALAAWGVNTIYKELGTTTLLPQNCVVCHDPHGTAKDANGKPLLGQLRFPIDVPAIDQNLCTKCHNRRSEATTAGSGPHGAQGPVLFGTAGYFPPGTLYDTTAILSTHGSSANPRTCAGCHVNKQTGVDANGNSVTFTGHSFHPLPCLQQKSPPVVDTTYANDCPYDQPSRSYVACTASGCHGTEAVALSRLQGIWNEKEDYLKVIWVDLNGNQAVDAYPADTGYLAKIKLNAPNELLNSTGVLTPAKGALFNAQLTGEKLNGHPDGSHGVHNPFLYRALLQSTIADLVANYPTFLPAPPAPVLSQDPGGDPERRAQGGAADGAGDHGSDLDAGCRYSIAIVSHDPFRSHAGLGAARRGRRFFPHLKPSAQSLPSGRAVLFAWPAPATSQRGGAKPMTTTPAPRARSMARMTSWQERARPASMNSALADRES